MSELTAAYFTTKWTKKFIHNKDNEIQQAIEDLRSKYSMSNEDYIKMMVGMQILGTRSYVERKFGGQDGNNSGTV